MPSPKTTRQWVVQDPKNGFDGLKLQDDVNVPQVGEYDVLVRIQAVSLNYRDLIIPLVRQSSLREIVLLTLIGPISISRGISRRGMLRWCRKGSGSRIQSL